jgi:hypothetical protein
MPTGIAISPATRPMPATQHTTMAIVCRGVMPIALNTPRSCTRSLVCSTTVLSTPSPATTLSSSVSVATSPMITKNCEELLALVLTEYGWPSLAPSASA